MRVTGKPVDGATEIYENDGLIDIRHTTPL